MVRRLPHLFAFTRPQTATRLVTTLLEVIGHVETLPDPIYNLFPYIPFVRMCMQTHTYIHTYIQIYLEISRRVYTNTHRFVLRIYLCMYLHKHCVDMSKAAAASPGLGAGAGLNLCQAAGPQLLGFPFEPGQQLPIGGYLGIISGPHSRGARLYKHHLGSLL